LTTTAIEPQLYRPTPPLETTNLQVAMLEWCSYCQRFMRESAPYENFAITHGCCPECVSQHDDLLARRAVQHGQFLRGIFQELLDAGRHSDFSAGMRTVEKAIAQNCRPVDILIGMIAPMLYEIGEEWKRGVLSVEGEHRFTAFCDKIIGLVENTIARSNAAPFVTRNASLLFLMNAPGNRHLLGLHILALWVHGHGANVRIIEDNEDISSLMNCIAADKPKYLLVSMALAEQCSRVAEIARTMQMLSPSVRPRIIVGGYAVKAGLISTIPGAKLLSDINALQIA
jgi:methanogenic corrinoid protein MtbC1